MNFTRSRLKYFYFDYLKNLKVHNPKKCLSHERYFENSSTIKKIVEFENCRNDQKQLFISIVFTGFFLKSQSEKEETPEQQVINMIKRSILCIQREEYDKAEQMLHLALKIAQEMQLKDGITYIYDVMANLAMEQKKFDKSEKLFTEVMKRLFIDGLKDDNIKVLHISSKIAHMSQLRGQFEKASQGFIWTIDKIQKKLKLFPDDKELEELYGITKNWYGQLLMEIGEFLKAKDSFLEALKILREYDEFNEDSLTILNNLSVACTNLNDTIEARKYLEQALKLAQKLPEVVEVGILKANLGLLYLKDGLILEAKDICSSAYRYGKKMKDEHVTEQAEYCLDQIKEALKK